MENSPLTEATAVTEVYGTGQKVIAAVLKYPRALYGDAVHAEDFCVEGRTITGVYVSTELRGCITRKGNYVALTLDTLDPAASTCHFGRAPGERLQVEKALLCVSQLRPLCAADKTILPPFFNQKTTKTDNGVADRFFTQSYPDPESGQVMRCNLFRPVHCIPRQKYPLVLFLHDAGACSEELTAPLAQGNGAVVWARDAESGRRPCFVAAPLYTTPCVDDAGRVGWEVDATVRLVKALCKFYPIDPMRIYATGQSMGCMLLCEMLLRNPGFFAGSLLVAGQWDPARMARATAENLWAVVSNGDERAFPVMRACMAEIERAGGNVSRGHLDALSGASVLSEKIRRQNAEGCNANFTWFEERKSLALAGKQQHISTWAKTYDIEELRTWLFEQRGGGPQRAQPVIKKEQWSYV